MTRSDHRYVLLLLALLAASCKDSSGSIHIVGLEDRPCNAVEEHVPDGGTAAPVILSGKIPIRVIPDSKIELSKVTVTAASTPVVVSEAPFIVELDTFVLPEGTVMIKADAEDTDGNQYSTSVSICIDNEVPNITLIEPTINSEVSIEDARLVLRYTASDQKIVRLMASLSTGQHYYETDCPIPAGREEQTCSLTPSTLKGAIPAGAEAVDMVLNFMARDQAGHEKAVPLNLKLTTHFRWMTMTGTVVNTPAVELVNDLLAVGTESGDILIFDLLQQQLRCQIKPPAIKQIGIATPLTVNKDRNTIFTATYDYLVAYQVTGNATSCALQPLWEPVFIEDGYLYDDAAPVLWEEKNLLYIIRRGEIAAPCALEVRNLNDSSLLKEKVVTDQSENISHTPVLADEGNTLYVGSEGGDLYAIDTSALPAGDLTERWSPVSVGSEIMSAPLVANDRLYFMTTNGTLHILNSDSGHEAVPSPSLVEETVNTLSNVVSADGKLFYVSINRALYSFDEQGSLTAQLDLNDSIGFSSPVIGPGGILYLATYGGQILAIASDLSQILWSYSTPDPDKFLTTPLIIQDSLLIVGSENGIIYAVDVTVPGS